MPELFGPDGKPISSSTYKNKKLDPPKTGTAFGPWSGRDLQFASLPGGGVVQFDLSRLTLSDFRAMRDHYQVNSSLSVLSFMQHQSDFHIECEDPRIAALCEEQISNIWTMLNRSLSQANWAGFSPNVLQWENDANSRTLVLDKVKDLVPEEAVVNWKTVLGWAPPNYTPPKFKVYDGIKIPGQNWPVPVDNSFWYPILMENGDYYGKKLLRPAFTSWFFSLLVHLFSNRYYERFGEPTPVGRAPFGENVEVGEGTEVPGNVYMLDVLQKLRSRGVVVLPNDITSQGHNSVKPTYDYDIQYLESQMRGADFERYLTRLDEEISLGLFTPILLLKTADVGSYNLGVGHMQMYLWMLNALNDDRKQYIDKYILSPMVNYNFSPNAPRAKIVFRKLGNVAADMLKELIVALIQSGYAKPDLDELGQMAGLSLKQIRQTTAPPPAPSTDPNTDPGTGGDGGGDTPANLQEVRATTQEIISRLRGQIETAFRNHSFGSDMRLSMGYKRKFEKSLEVEGVQNPVSRANEFYGSMDSFLADLVVLGEREFSGPDAMMALIERSIGIRLDEIASAIS